MKDTVAARAIKSPGTEGNVTTAHVTITKSQLSSEKKKILSWCQQIRWIESLSHICCLRCLCCLHNQHSVIKCKKCLLHCSSKQWRMYKYRVLLRSGIFVILSVTSETERTKFVTNI